jgi:hypothetical protein
MHEAILDLAVWDKLTIGARLEVAREMAESLPAIFTFEGIEARALGGQYREIALFRDGECRFALVPGHPAATLGYDRARPFRPTPAQSEDWARSIQTEFGQSLGEALDETLSPSRTVAIKPILVEVKARSFDFDQDEDGRAAAYVRITQACAPQFRLPTADEWEYFCAAGTHTLFRWGDDCPISRSQGKQSWDLHRRPNAFGLLMNCDTYSVELCSGPQVRGGDGGCAVHGGIGKVSTWLPLASSFVVSDEELEDWGLDKVMVRRVVPCAIHN